MYLTSARGFLCRVFRFLVRALRIAIRRSFLLFIVPRLVSFEGEGVVLFLVLGLLRIGIYLTRVLNDLRLFQLLSIGVIGRAIVNDHGIAYDLSNRPTYYRVDGLNDEGRGIRLLESYN